MKKILWPTSYPRTRLFTIALLAIALDALPTQAQITVQEIRVLDTQDRGVISEIRRRTLDGEQEVDQTDAQGILPGPVSCPDGHRLYAKPVAGPYSDSHYQRCTEKMKLRVTKRDAYPELPVRVIVPFSPGVPADQMARAVTESLTREWKQPFVVDNRAGAGGNIGTALAAQEAPNGYTLLWGTSQLFTINPNLYSKTKYDPRRDFVPVTMVAAMPEVLVASSELPVRSVKELVAYAKSKPGAIAFSSNGRGSAGHLAGELFNATAGVRLMHVPYKGAGAAISAVKENQVQIAFASSSSVIAEIKAGKLTALGITGTSRSPLLPDVPTLAESGVKDYDIRSWQGVFSPARTAQQIVNRLSSAIGRALKTDTVQRNLAQMAAEPVGNTPGQFSAAIERESAQWARLVRASSLLQK